MSGTRLALARIVAIGTALALAVLLLAAREATAAKYAVAQCGWYVGADASWADTTGGAKFRSDGWCVPPAGQDPFDGVHLKSFTREGQATVSGMRFARWRWEAPPGTAISQVRGTWWHALHDGMEQRIGVGTWGGGFDVFASAAATDTTPREFVAGFDPAQPALEDRLLCARAESKWCSLEPGSFAAIRALTITLEDNQPPSAAIGGALVAGGWRRGVQVVGFQGGDVGGGVRFGETTIDGGRVNLTEYPCAEALIGSEWRATQMRPCGLAASGSAAIDTARFSDGPHALRHCATDFAGNVACTPDQTVFVDNNPPAHPRGPTISGGEGWRRTNRFDVSWANPDQGLASAIGGALWRITGASGFDSGVKLAPGHELTALGGLSVPASGLYTLHLWLRDEAGNDAPSSAVDLPLRLDEVPPSVAFENEDGSDPEQVRAILSDALSGAARGEIDLRRLGGEQWTELPTKFQPGEGTGPAHLIAAVPANLDPGIYLFRAVGFDGAGNSAETTRRADGSEMTVRRAASDPGSPAARKADGAGGKARIYARIRWRTHAGTSLTVPFGAASRLAGRLVDADGAGLAERALRVVARPSRGSLWRAHAVAIRTGAHGGFHLLLPPGPSRRIAVSFAGAPSLERAIRAPLTLRVRGGVSLHAAPARLDTGEAVRFTGRVRTMGAPIPRRGKQVAIQYYDSTAKRWRPVLLTRSDHSGRFHARYRFRYVTGSATVRLRAEALAEDRWPYAPGASRPVTVRVTG